MELSCGNSWKFMLELKSWSGAANCNLMPHWEYMENECGCLLYTSREIVAVKPGELAITNYEWSMLVKYIPKTFTSMSYVAGRGWELALRRVTYPHNKPFHGSEVNWNKFFIWKNEMENEKNEEWNDWRSYSVNKMEFSYSDHYINRPFYSWFF